MGKDKHKDGETAATSDTNPQDGCQDTQRDHSQDQEARDIALAQTITEAAAREMAKAHVHHQAILNEEVQQPFQPTLKYLQDHMVLRLWTPSIGQRTNLSPEMAIVVRKG